MSILSAEQLIDRDNHAWDEIVQLLEKGNHTYEILPADRRDGEETLRRLQVSTRSYLGAIAYEAGGIRLDHGWITLLGAGAERIYGNLCSWNGLQDQLTVKTLAGKLVVAYDAAGGFFALDTGDGQICYFAPDTLEWESTELAYSGFINWLAVGDLQQFYETFRWQDWKQQTEQLESGQVFAYYPPLWTAEGGGETSSKQPVSVMEAWQIVLDKS
ncbi:DUF2625 family protein [Paenibacillus wulumuqiensis]|uniref:DUF2625 family protein n=1 Tax=Paenibacillus wulumuqiensis TaxID=1567107 RepID=UPI00061962B0|nr:DUF2625 family protein [Paenibacillus wulumuqiensis]